MHSTPLISNTARALLVLLNVVVVVLCIGGFKQIREKPSIRADVSEDRDRITIRMFTDGVPVSATGHSPMLGDTILAVDGVTTASATAFETLLDARRIGESARLTIKRGESITDIDVPLRPHYSFLYAMIVLIVGTIFFSLGVLVLAKRPEDPAALSFHLAMDCVTVMLFATAGRHVIEPYGLGHIVRVGDLTAYAFMTAIFFHFTLQFPTPKWPALLRRIGWIYVAAGIVAVATSVMFLLATLDGYDRWLASFATTFDICQSYFIVLGLLSVASLVHSYRTSLEQAERIKLRWVLSGATVGFLSFIVLQLIPRALGEPPLLREEWIVLLAGVAPVAFAIAIVRYRVMDVDLLLSRSTVYTILLATLALVYTGLVLGLREVAQAITGSSGEAVPIVATIAIALIFEPARARVQSFVDRRFFRTRYNLRQAQRMLADELNACAESNRLAASAIEILERILAPERIALSTIRRADDVVMLLAGRGLPTAAEMTAAVTDIATIRPGEIHADERWIEPGVEVATDARAALDPLGICCAIAAPFNDGHIVLLLVGPKKSGTRYSIEDLEVLRAAITHTSLGLERIMLQTNILRREAEAEHLRELDRIKSEFVSSVSHELKTPLTSIRMFAEMLQSEREVERERVRRYAKIIESESRRLTRQIDNVLDFSKIERGAKEYRFAPVDLAGLVDGVLESLEHQIASAGFVLERHDEAERIELHADPDALTGALVNLISNAIKYSDTQREITVRTFKRDGCAGIAVADKGVGLSSDDRARIFDPFFRTETARTSGTAGTGLGLALIRHVVAGHGGSIELESAEGAGSTFTLLFPLNPNETIGIVDEKHTVDRG